MVILRQSEATAKNDEDQGQMAGISALMAMGLFSLDGGSAYNPMYDITSPVFNEITIRLDSRYYKGNEFKIKVHDNSPENCYIQKASLNGEMYHKYQLPHTVFEQGGLLELWLGDKPKQGMGNSITIWAYLSICMMIQKKGCA